mmetsp:Transcript_87857/g.250326  ORF Transcript_87857/g.250326 Transcript_87857/m.250326 type:complete len:219 (+) Transcript_87857:61-717(+)
MSMPSCPRASFGAKQKLAESADKPIPYRTRCYLYVERFMQAGKRNVTVGLRRVEYEPLTQSARWVLNDPHLRHLEKVECGCSWLVSWPNQARVERPANLAHSAFQPLLEPDQLRVVLREPHKPCPTHEERLPSCLSSHDATYGACTLVTFTRSGDSRFQGFVCVKPSGPVQCRCHLGPFDLVYGHLQPPLCLCFKVHEASPLLRHASQSQQSTPPLAR